MYKVTNWGEYNDGLRKRGDITICSTEKAISAWAPKPTQKRGTTTKYYDGVILCYVRYSGCR